MGSVLIWILGLTIVVFVAGQFKYQIFSRNLKNQQLVAKIRSANRCVFKPVSVSSPAIKIEPRFSLVDSINNIVSNPKFTGESSRLGRNIGRLIVRIPLVQIIEIVRKGTILLHKVYV